MSNTMWRVAKHAGVGNVVVEQVAVPKPGPDEALVRTTVSLISRGSELTGRYEREAAVDPDRMGYSTTGTIERYGANVTGVEAGDRVFCAAPHAEYSLKPMNDVRRGRFRIWPLHPDVSFEAGTFHQLTTSAACWVKAAGITPRDSVVVLGQGIVGNLVLQFARLLSPALLVAVDALEIRRRAASAIGAPIVIDSGDVVAEVKRLTGGKGATVVANCVGGHWAATAFEQSQEMLAPGGLLHQIGLSGDVALPFHPNKMMERRILGGYPPEVDRQEMAGVAMAAMAAGEVRVEPLITHRFPGKDAKRAYDLLHEHPDQALGVLLQWNDA